MLHHSTWKGHLLSEVIGYISSNQDAGVLFETRGFEVGTVDYIHKPFSPPVVTARVSTQLMERDAHETVCRQLEAINGTGDGAVQSISYVLLIGAWVVGSRSGAVFRRSCIPGAPRFLWDWTH